MFGSPSGYGLSLSRKLCYRRKTGNRRTFDALLVAVAVGTDLTKVDAF